MLALFLSTHTLTFVSDPRMLLQWGNFRSVIQPERVEEEGHDEENYTNGYKRRYS